jgi:hypothetical protein
LILFIYCNNLQEVLDKWIQDRRYPLVSQLSLSNWRALTNGSGKKTVVAVVDPSQKDFASYIHKQINKQTNKQTNQFKSKE